MRCHYLFRLFILNLLIIIFPVTASAQSVKVAVMPFQVFAEKDHASLQRGIVDMLAARLAAPDQVTVIDPLATARAAEHAQGLTGDRLARAVGAELKADYILYGSVTIFAESISIDAKMINISDAKGPSTFFKQAQGMGQVVPSVDLLAKDIVSRVFNRPASGQTPEPVITPATSETTTKKETINVHAHPEKLLEELRSGSDEE